MFSRQPLFAIVAISLASAVGFGLAFLFRTGTYPTLLNVTVALVVLTIGSIILPMLLSAGSKSRSGR